MGIGQIQAQAQSDTLEFRPNAPLLLKSRAWSALMMVAGMEAPFAGLLVLFLLVRNPTGVLWMSVTMLVVLIVTLLMGAYVVRGLRSEVDVPIRLSPTEASYPVREFSDRRGGTLPWTRVGRITRRQNFIERYYGVETFSIVSGSYVRGLAVSFGPTDSLWFIMVPGISKTDGDKMERVVYHWMEAVGAARVKPPW